MRQYHCRLTTSILTVAVLATLLSEVAYAQRVSCEGFEFYRDSTGHMIALHLARSETGEWSLTHARLDRIGANRAKNLSALGDSLVVSIEGIPAEYRGRVSGNGRALTGELVLPSTRVPMTLGCRRIVPDPPDASPHRTLFVTVAPDVRLEVLDFGGTGRPVILIHGMNASAHDYDLLGPKLAADYRVYAITRRGLGRSSVPDSGYDAFQLGDDVLAVMDSLRIVRPVLVGHSYGGAEVSSVGTRHRDRVAGLVYLDAPFGYLDPSEPDRFARPGSMRCPCTYIEKINMGMRAFRQIHAPALAIYAMDGEREFKARHADSFERNVRGSRVVRLADADHYVFRSNEADVLRELRAFINGLP